MNLNWTLYHLRINLNMFKLQLISKMTKIPFLWHIFMKWHSSISSQGINHTSDILMYIYISSKIINTCMYTYMTKTNIPSHVQIKWEPTMWPKMNNTWALFSPITQFTTHRHKSRNVWGVQLGSKGLSDVINGGGLCPPGVKRSRNHR